MPAYLRPMAPTAARVLLCGDPARALALAQDLLVEPRMSNHHRGLWGYHGHTPEGLALTVQATGIGGPSACAVLGELLDLGARLLLRVGSCRAEEPAPPLGACLAADRIFAAEGAAAAHGAVRGRPLGTDPALTASLRNSLGRGADVLSTDTWDDPGAAGAPTGRPIVRDLQSGAIAALATARGVPFGAALVVAAGPAGRLEDDPLDAASLRAGRAAAAALAAVEPRAAPPRGLTSTST